MQKLLAALLCTAFLLVGCSPNAAEEDALPKARDKGSLANSNGGRLDVLVVCKDALWNGIAGNMLARFLTQEQYGLPQPEPLFSVRQIDPSEFNRLLQNGRNLIILEEGDSSYAMRTNVWAKPQLVTMLSGTAEQMAKTIKEKSSEIFQAYYQMELETMLRRMEPLKVEALPKALKNLGIESMALSKAFSVEVANDSVAILWSKTVKSDQVISIYSKPIRPNTLVEAQLISLRDSLMRHYIPAEYEGSYLITEDMLPARVSTTEIDGLLTFEIRGLWRTIGELKGGPFINYSFVDENNNRILMVDAFIYAPEISKRNTLFELETMLRSIRLED